MYFIDTHCHLHSPWFDDKAIQKIVTDANENNVRKIVSCASDPAVYEQVIRSSKYGGLYVSLGLQPTQLDKVSGFEDLKEKLNGKDRIVALGEVGLDYYWEKDDNMREKQKQIFMNCIDLATELNLPLVIHSRKAEKDCLQILEQKASTPVLLHSFEGNLELINTAKDLGYLISIPTNVVIRSNRRKIAKRAGLERIVLETDSPFCSPSNEIKTNTPSTIPIAAKKLSEIFECTMVEIATMTSKNAEKFYQIE